MKELFIDTSFLLGVADPDDQWYEAAMEALVQSGDAQLVTTEEVLIEYLNAMSRSNRTERKHAVDTVIDLLGDPDITVYAQSHETFMQGLDLYRRRLDKSYSLVDCISMRCMKDEGIGEILSADRHFAQEGFVPLMLG